MNKIVISFLLTIFAGLSTLIGYFMIFIKGDKEKIITFSLSFSASVMITLSFIDLIPLSLNYLNNYMFFLKFLIFIFFFLLGIYLSFFLSHKIDNHNSLKKIGIISLLTIILHNIPEGIVTFIISGIDLNLGISLGIAIGLHNIPEGISIAIPIYYGTKNKLKTFIIVFVAGLSEVLGAVFCFLFLSNCINNFFIGVIFAIISGMMINISISELLSEVLKYKKNKFVILGLIIGAIVIILSKIL